MKKERVFELVEVGYAGDFYSRAYDFLGVLAIVVNIGVNVLDTFDNYHTQYGGLLSALETVTVLFFTADYALRVWTADQLYPRNPHPVRKYVFSLTGIIDLLCFLPWYLPVFFPAGAVAFRMFRVVRIFRLFRINTYYDSPNVITEVISGKRQQLISSVFILFVLMLGASLCMYSLEHDAQPDVFANAFSGIWWAASTLLTVGYGDIYPMTSAGRLFGICITFLGVGIVAIPTGIISAGFVEQYSKIKRLSEIADEVDIHFIKLRLTRQDAWTGRRVKELGLPRGVILAAVRRGQAVIVPRGNITLEDGDTVILGAEPLRDDQHIDFQEVTLRRQHPWNGKAIRDLDISRHTLIVTVRRGNRALIPNGDLVLKEGDSVTLYTQIPISDAQKVRI